MSKQTSNHYRQAIHQLCRWLIRRGYLKTNPVAEIPKLNVATDRRHDRRALTEDEFCRLIVAAESSPDKVQSIPGTDRAMMYNLSAWTGYRRKEIGSLKLSSFSLESDPPTVTVDASYSKRKRKDTQVLHPEVAERFRQWLNTRTPTHPVYVFPISRFTAGWDRKTSEMMKHDLASARTAWIEEGTTEEERLQRTASDFLSYKNETGLFADFHANRHTFITNLSRAGVAPKVAQTLARHSDVRLTMNVYTHTDLGEKRDAVARLPSPNGHKASQAGSARQRHNSAPESDNGEISARESAGDIAKKTEGKNGLERKPLNGKDLARHDSQSQEENQVHPTGLEPVTLGSEGDSDKRENTRISFVFRHFIINQRYCKDGQSIAGNCNNFGNRLSSSRELSRRCKSTFLR